MDKEFSLISTKLDSDIIEFMKLLKKKYGTRSMSEGARLFYREFAPDILDKAQNLAEIRASISEIESEEK